MPKGRNVKNAAISLQMDWENAQIEALQTIWRLIAELLGLPGAGRAKMASALPGGASTEKTRNDRRTGA